ncbi:MAG: BtrH N-terminal domain-containing protein [Chloroflexota bacterium]
MPVLSNYNHFAGRHWETGTIHNYFAARGFNAPHTGQPYSEALLMGISGGVVMGYFSFEYDGYDPLLNVLTRNTFDPWDTMLSRLGVVQEVMHTSKPVKAIQNITDTLAEGIPAIVWADMWSLPYNALKHDEGMWGNFPLVVYGYDEENDVVHIADRAGVGLTASTEVFATARARIKKDKHRVMTLDMPDPEKLASAVQMGVHDCVKLFTEKPPRGGKNSFGFAAYQHWAKLLTKPKQRNSWEKVFPAGGKMFAGLTFGYHYIFHFGKGTGNGADRLLYADFLDEAAVILDKPDLAAVGDQFRASASAWATLGEAMLPDDAPLFAEAKASIQRRQQLFIEQGNDALSEILSLKDADAVRRAAADNDSPLSEAEVIAYRENLAEKVLAIHDIEVDAVGALQAVMTG